MLTAIRNFFDRHIAGPAEEAPIGAQHVPHKAFIGAKLRVLDTRSQV